MVGRGRVPRRDRRPEAQLRLAADRDERRDASSVGRAAEADEDAGRAAPGRSRGQVRVVEVVDVGRRRRWPALRRSASSRPAPPAARHRRPAYRAPTAAIASSAGVPACWPDPRLTTDVEQGEPRVLGDLGRERPGGQRGEVVADRRSRRRGCRSSWDSRTLATAPATRSGVEDARREHRRVARVVHAHAGHRHPGRHLRDRQQRVEPAGHRLRRRERARRSPAARCARRRRRAGRPTARRRR